MKYRVIVCGGRTELNYYTASSYLYDVFQSLGIEDAEIVSGGCNGADKIGERFAEENGFNVVQFLPEWTRYGKAAGIIRNKAMVNYIKDSPNSIVIAFWNGTSRGTKSTINQASKFNIPVYIVNYSNRVLFEGVTIDNGKLIYDFDNDTTDDVISLTNTKIHSSKLKGNTYYYEYKINKKSPNHKDLLKQIKDEPITGDLRKLIDIAIEDICAEVKGVDCVIHPQSHSSINNYMATKLAERFNANLIEAKKQVAKNIEFDWDRFLKTFRGDEACLADFEKYINKILEQIHQKEHVSLTNDVLPRYRQYIKNFLTLDGANVLMANKIIILDDIISTGTTISALISLTRSLGFSGDIVVFSLISNR